MTSPHEGLKRKAWDISGGIKLEFFKRFWHVVFHKRLLDYYLFFIFKPEH
jgi:hypothetical protein